MNIALNNIKNKIDELNIKYSVMNIVIVIIIAYIIANILSIFKVNINYSF